MKQTLVVGYGTMAAVYEGDVGDQIPWHNHKKSHGHLVIRGATLVEIEGKEPIKMFPGMPNMILEPILSHQINIIKPDTIFLNVSPFGNEDDPFQKFKTPTHGGVMLADGTVTYEIA